MQLSLDKFKTQSNTFRGEKKLEVTMYLSEPVCFASGPHSACVNRPCTWFTTPQNTPHQPWPFNRVVSGGLC